MQFNNPDNLQDAYRLLASDDWKILSGGTDFYPALGEKTVDFNVLDVSRISSLHGIKKDADGNLHIGARVTWTEIINHDLPPAFNGLKLSAREVGSIQIQNRATVVGNICNASPAADGVPSLLTLGAIVKVGSLKGDREISLDRFILGNREIDLRSDEIVTGIKIPATHTEGESTFIKLGARKYLVISIAMVATRIAVDTKGCIEDAAISIGSCSLVAKRLRDLENALLGTTLSDSPMHLMQDSYFEELTPIDDVRATNQYRREACRELVVRSLEKIAGA